MISLPAPRRLWWTCSFPATVAMNRQGFCRCIAERWSVARSEKEVIPGAMRVLHHRLRG